MAAVNEAWVWVDASVLLAVHDEQIAEHGGAIGIRDAGLFESALARPMQLAAYGEPDAAALAAAYGFGLARNHPFVDGNKRTAFVAVELFLLLNGHELVADDVDCVLTMLKVAAGELPEADFAEWLRTNSVKR
jgi:death-on-curing protein